jgi:hypothetical protein
MEKAAATPKEDEATKSITTKRTGKSISARRRFQSAIQITTL